MDIEWIEINLPYALTTQMFRFERAPTLDDKVRAQFGVTNTELEDRIDALDSEVQWEAYTQARCLMEQHDHDAVKALEAFQKTRPTEEPLLRIAQGIHDTLLRNQILHWWHQQPEVKQWDADRIQAERDWRAAHQTFCDLDLNQPGTLIELEDGTRHLIGSINAVQGVCDDCVAFESTTIVKRYAVLTTPEDLGLGNHIAEE